jgi:hypothetical protein
MKLLFCLLSAMLSLGLAAQKPFEGTIRYRLSFPSLLPDSTSISIFFGPGKVLLRVNQGERMATESDLLIDLDSGYLHMLNAGSKTYRTQKLRSFGDKPQVPPGNKTILGYAATGVTLGGAGGSMRYSRAMSMAERAVVYTANDLVFPVPEKYRLNPELLFVHNGHIVLGGELVMGRGNNHEDEGSGEMPPLSFEAFEIIRQPVDPALLRIPAGYEKWSSEEMELWDSAVAYGDTVILEEVPITDDEQKPPPPPPAPPKPKAKKYLIKGPATKKPATKTTSSGTKKQAARKPE